MIDSQTPSEDQRAVDMHIYLASSFKLQTTAMWVHGRGQRDVQKLLSEAVVSGIKFTVWGQ